MENGLFTKPENCEFHKGSVSFLGYIIRQGYLAADPAKVRAVTEWPVPGTCKDALSRTRKLLSSIHPGIQLDCWTPNTPPLCGGGGRIRDRGGRSPVTAGQYGRQGITVFLF